MIEPAWAWLVVVPVILSPFVSIAILIRPVRTRILGKHKLVKTIMIVYLIAVELLLLFAIFFAPTPHDRKHLQAFVDYYENKTPETKAVLDRETSRMKREQNAFAGTLAGVFVVNAIGVIVLTKGNKSQPNNRIKTDQQ